MIIRGRIAPSTPVDPHSGFRAGAQGGIRADPLRSPTRRPKSFRPTTGRQIFRWTCPQVWLRRVSRQVDPR